MSKVLIVGGGAAGMMAGIAAAENGNEVHLFEKNEKLGKKLFITGKGRCNITNACDMEELMKVPDSVIIKSLRDEVKTLRRKNHEICVKAKEREQQWKAHVDCLTEKIVELQRDDTDEEKKAIKREARAIKKANEDYNNLLEQYNHLREKHEQLKEQMRYLKDELEGRPVGVAEISRKEIRKKFTNLKNRREIMDAMAFAYNEEMPIAYNVVVFLEWVRVSGKWDELYARMFNVYTE